MGGDYGSPGTWTGLLGLIQSEHLRLELTGVGIPYEREVVFPVVDGGVELPMGFRADLLVDQAVIVEILSLMQSRLSLHLHPRMKCSCATILACTACASGCC
ncbi:MAG: GxxExxY protein [Acetobacteraceae bacterium]